MSSLDVRSLLVWIDCFKGDVEIWLGSGALTAGYQFPGYSNIGDVSSDSPKIAVYGDIFGDGNFSGIGGDSTLTFDGYRQTSDVNVQRIRSIQLADTVVMEDSEVQLSGSSAGGSADLTERMSLNKIGRLEMHGHSVLTLHAEMNEIGAFASYNSRGNLAMPSDFDGSCGNTLRLIDGALAMILGDGNDGVSTGQDMAGMVYGNPPLGAGLLEHYAKHADLQRREEDFGVCIEPDFSIRSVKSRRNGGNHCVYDDCPYHRLPS